MLKMNNVGLGLLTEKLSFIFSFLKFFDLSDLYHFNRNTICDCCLYPYNLNLTPYYGQFSSVSQSLARVSDNSKVPIWIVDTSSNPTAH